ncbi:MAG: 4-alpha-glucanotransferase [Ruminococcaceae bacterium]|nr:4-alpha-glucanotransferase [Oscillospiraceae bacterium]
MRESGILMHITSLPGRYGVGTMGKQAHRFVDFLQAAGQRFWQILPLNPTGYGDSPYQSCSAYAGNHYLIDLELLVEEGLLQEEELQGIFWGEREDKVDFGLLYQNRLKVLRLAYDRFRDQAALDAFCGKNWTWLADFALFMALKDHFQGLPWYAWEDGAKFRQPETIAKLQTELADLIRFYCFVQYLFDKQWNALRAYAHSKNVRLIGDVPIYVPYDSVEVWCEPRCFQLDEALAPTAVAGCPPDAFSEDGQLWGNPLYRWDAMQEDGYSWWLRRLAAAGTRYDVVRLDHFRGFEAYWSVPAQDETARNGHWVKGPGMDLIRAVKENLPGLNMIAEDLGFLTQEVLDLRDNSGFPGMKVLEFAFDSRDPSDYLPHNYPVNSVCYIGTHDNMTLCQWLETASAETRAYATEYMGLNEQEGPVWGVVRTAMSSVSKLCILQMQDLLELGGEARMNFPGTMTGANWTWRAKAGFTDGLASRLYQITKRYGRLADYENSPKNGE